MRCHTKFRPMTAGRGGHGANVLLFLRFLLAEVAVEESFEAAAVACFVLCHFVYGVVDGVEVELLCAGCDAHLVGACSGLGVHALFEVGLCVPNDVAEELGEA